MGKLTQSPILPFTVKAPWVVKIISLSLLAFYPWLLYSPDTFISAWNESHLLAKLCFLFMMLTIPYWVMKVFYTKTVFYNDYVINVNSIMVKKQFSYNEISEVKITTSKDIKLKLHDGSLVKVLCGSTYLGQVLSILKSKIGNIEMV